MTTERAPGDTVALVGGTVVNVHDGTTTEDATVIVEGGRIARIGGRGDTEVPRNARVVSVEGRWVLPGLINAHSHYGIKHRGADSARLAFETDQGQVLRMAGHARGTVRAGITTVRLTGESHGNDHELIAGIEAGYVSGPRIVTAGPIITTSGGHGRSGKWGDGPYDLARIAREEIHKGARWVKLAISGGLSDARGDVLSSPMTDDEMKTVIEASHRMGVPVTAHCSSNGAARQAIQFGIDCLEHGYGFDEETLTQMKTQDVWLVPTIVVSRPGALDGLYKRIGAPAPTSTARRKSVVEIHWKALQTAIRIGVKIALGTDTNPHEECQGTIATVREAEYYVEAGMTALAALQSTTIRAAELLGMEAEIGQLSVGSHADVIAVDGNPVDDIAALRQITFVMKGGEVVRDDHSREVFPVL